MKKLYMILFVMVLLVSSFVYSLLGDFAYYQFENTVIDTFNNFSLTDDSSVYGIGILNKAVDCDGADKFFNTSATDLGTVSTISVWLNSSSWVDEEAVFSLIEGTSTNNVIQLNRDGSSGNLIWYLRRGGAAATKILVKTSPATGVWYHTVLVMHSNGTVTSYLNGDVVEYDDTADERPQSHWPNIGICDYRATATIQPFSGLIDNVYVSTVEANQTTITSWYNLGAGFDHTFLPPSEPGTPVPPTWTIPPDNTWTNNTNITMRLTHDSNVRYSIYFNDVIQYYNVSQTGAFYFSFVTNLSDGIHTLKAQVYNETSGNWSSNVTRIWTLETEVPIITLNPPNSFDINSVSRINQYANYLFFNISFTDNSELFGVEINITKDGISYYNFTNITLGYGNKTYNFTRNISTSPWPSGVYNINISASDSHTTNSIGDYKPNNGINTIRFDTPEGNHIEISSDGSAYSTLYDQKGDRYEFGWNYLFADTTRKFTLESDNKIYYLPNSEYKAHFVIGGAKSGNWIDFEGIGDDYSVKKIKDNKYVITFINLPLTNQIISKSLGGLNSVTETYFWFKGNHTISNPFSSTFGNTETFSLNITRNNTFAIPNASLIYDGVEYLPSSTLSDDYIIFSRDLIIPNPFSASNLINFSWIVNISQSLNGSYIFNIPSSINISQALVDNCTFYNRTILKIIGKDEETDEDVNMSLNIVFILSNGANNSYELTGRTNYTFCSDSEINYTLDSIMEYGDETYTGRKYYLNDFQIDITTIAEVFLYHLNNSKASEIVFTVFDTTTGDRVKGAFIKILRYYPGEDVYRIVEISKTDETGQTLGKMVLADVFYKFIIEAPAGTVKLDTGVLRILSLTRSFGISFVVDVLDTWNKIHSVSYSTTCTKGTKTCRITWSDESNIVQDVTLEVWRITGLSDKLLFKQTTAASSGTISYTVTEDTATNTYVARGFIESNTGTSRYPGGTASFFYSDNPFFTDETHRLASLFPLLLLVIVIVFALIDWGVIGIVIGSLIGLILGSIVGILPLSPFYFVSFIIIGIILMYKLSK